MYDDINPVEAVSDVETAVRSLEGCHLTIRLRRGIYVEDAKLRHRWRKPTNSQGVLIGIKASGAGPPHE